MNDPEANKAVVARYMRAIGAGDIEGARALVAAGFTHNIMGTAMGGAYGLEEIFGAVRLLASVVQEIVLVPEQQIADRNVVAMRARGDMTTIEGKPYHNNYVFWAELQDGKLTRFYEYMDTQMGNDVLGPLFQARAGQ